MLNYQRVHHLQMRDVHGCSTPRHVGLPERLMDLQTTWSCFKDAPKQSEDENTFGRHMAHAHAYLLCMYTMYILVSMYIYIIYIYIICIIHIIYII
jgi:hypothetical protein